MASATKRKALAFEVEVTPKKLRSDDVPTPKESVLVLAPFQPHPKLTLENVRIGSTGRLQLTFLNPTTKEMNIELVNVPSEVEGLTFSQTQMTIAGDSSTMLAVTWTPRNECKPTRHVVGVRPVGRARNLSEIVLTMSTLQSQGLRSRMKKQDKLAKTELKMKSTCVVKKPLSENNNYSETVPFIQTLNMGQDITDDRRATFTKSKPLRSNENVMTQQMPSSRPTPTITSQQVLNNSSPLRSSDPVVDMSTPGFFNKTFNLSSASSANKAGGQKSSVHFSRDSLEIGTSAMKPSGQKSLDRFSADSLELETERDSLEPGTAVATPAHDISEGRSQRRRLTRSNERIDIDLFNLELPADLLRNTQPDVTRRRCTKSAERIGVDVSSPAKQLDCLKDKDKCPGRRLARSNERVFNLDLLADQRPSHFDVQLSPERWEAGLKDERPHRRLTRSSEHINLSSIDLNLGISSGRNDGNPILAPSPSKRSRPNHATSRRRDSLSLQTVFLDDSIEKKIDQLSFSTDLDLDVGHFHPTETIRHLDQQVTLTDSTPKKAVEVSLKEHDGASSATVANTDSSTVTKAKVISNTAVGQLEGVGFWQVSPPKRIRTKPPSDSPVVLPPPSRVFRRSTMKVSHTNSRTFTKANRRKVDNTTIVGNTPSITATKASRSDVENTTVAGNTYSSLTVTKASRSEDVSSAAVGQPDCASSSEGVGVCQLSPPKQLKTKPPSDSPIFRPPPSRVARRSTISQRLSSRPARTVLMPATETGPKRKFVSDASDVESKSPAKSSCSVSSVYVDALSSASVSSVYVDAVSTVSSVIPDAVGSDCDSVFGDAVGSLCVSVPRPRHHSDMEILTGKSAQATKTRTWSVSRLVPRRLKFSSCGSVTSLKSASSMTSLPTSSFLCPQTPSASFLGHTIDLSKNPFHQNAIIYLENSWIDETEKDLLKWINKILSPPQELQTTCLMPSKQEMQCVRAPIDTNVPQPPLYRLFSVRRAATALLLSSDVAQTLHKVHAAIDKGTIAVRADKDLHRDLGLQGIVLRLLMCYNPLWLRVALEAVYGRPIPLHSNSDVVGLVVFIRRHLLTDQYLKTTHSHPTVPHLMLPSFEEKMKKFILTKFVMIVYFLDRAKTLKLIRHDPCLFCKDSPFKDSRAIMIEFNKELMKGGDMTRYLGTMGLKLEYKQTYLEEFEYRVKDRSDLRDGIRLAKLVDTLLNVCVCAKLRVPTVSRTQKLYNVSLSLTAYTEHTGNELENGVTERDIVDGHRERTLSLIWQLRDMRQQHAACVLVAYWLQNKEMIKLRMRFHRQRDAAQRVQRWWRATLARRQATGGERKAFLRLRQAAVVVQRRWRVVRAIRMERERMQKLRQAAILMQRRWRALLQRRQFLAKREEARIRTENAAILIQRQWRAQVQMKNQRRYYLKLRVAAILMQRRWRALLQRRQFLAEREEARIRTENAAILIQRQWRAQVQMKNQRRYYLELQAAAILMQRRWRALLEQRRFLAKIEEARIRTENAAIMIQRQWRAQVQMKNQRRYYLELRTAAILMQRRWRALLERRQFLAKREEARIRTENAAILIQRQWRAQVQMKNQRRYYLELQAAAILMQRRWRALLEQRRFLAKKEEARIRTENAAILIQRQWRAQVQMKNQRRYYLELQAAAILMQRRWRALLERRQFLAKREEARIRTENAAILIQRQWRAQVQMKNQRRYYLELQAAAILMQRRWRALLEQRRFLAKKEEARIRTENAAILIQRQWRAQVQMKNQRRYYLELQAAAILMQRRWRALLERRQFLAKREEARIRTENAAILIQRQWRAQVQMKNQRRYYLELRGAAILMQRRWRALLEQRRFLAKKEEARIRTENAAILIQRQWRAQVQMKNQRRYYLELQAAAILMQRRWRALLERRQFLAKREEARIITENAAILIQRQWRAQVQMKNQRRYYLELQAAAILMQRRWRALLERRQFLAKREEARIRTENAAILIQRQWRAQVQMRRDRTSYVNLRNAVSIVTEQRLAMISMRKQRAAYNKLKESTIILQQKIRATLLMRREKARYLALKRAVSVVTARRLALLRMRICRNVFLGQRSAIIKVQLKWKTKFAIKMAEKKSAQWLENARKSVAVISERRIAQLKMRQVRSNYLKTRAAIVTIQRRWRQVLAVRNQQQQARSNHLITLNRHACVIQGAMRSWMEKKKDRKRHMAAIVIQRLWRGYWCRQRLRKEDSRHSLRAMRVLPAGHGGKTLRERKQGLLQTIYQSASLHVLIRSLRELDAITTMSSLLAEELVQDGIVAALHNLLKNVLSRSASDQDAALLVVTVLANLYKHSAITNRVWTISMGLELPAQIFHWASNTCRSNTKLFCACITLLWLFAHKPENCPSLVTSETSFLMKRIAERVAQLKEADARSSQRARAGTSVVRRTPSLPPSTTPDWGYTMRVNHRPRVFQDPIHAWAQLKILLGPRQTISNR